MTDHTDLPPRDMHVTQDTTTGSAPLIRPQSALSCAARLRQPGRAPIGFSGGGSASPLPPGRGAQPTECRLGWRRWPTAAAMGHRAQDTETLHSHMRLIQPWKTPVACRGRGRPRPLRGGAAGTALAPVAKSGGLGNSIFRGVLSVFFQAASVSSF